MIVALDGPAASGKGTLAKRLAAHYRLPHLDTGLLYRGVAHLVLDRGGDLDDEDAAVVVAHTLDVRGLDESRLRGREMGEAASRVAAIPEVRRALLDLQRRFATQPGGAVLDGRDIGTVIAPDAEVKIYVTASVEERARRRHAELMAAGMAGPDAYDAVLAELTARDARDAGRADAPMRVASDAVLLDTTVLDIDAAFRAAIAIVEAARAAGTRRGSDPG